MESAGNLSTCSSTSNVRADREFELGCEKEGRKAPTLAVMSCWELLLFLTFEIAKRIVCHILRTGESG